MNLFLLGDLTFWCRVARRLLRLDSASELLFASHAATAPGDEGAGACSSAPCKKTCGLRLSLHSAVVEVL
jgi:hypothetical protein